MHRNALKPYIRPCMAATAAIAGFALLSAHIGCLENTYVSGFCRRPFAPSFAKPVLYGAWFFVIIALLRTVKNRLRTLRHYTLKPAIGRRCAMAALVFCATVVPYAPLDHDLTLHFFLNALGITLLLTGLFHLPGIACPLRFCGRHFALLLRFPGHYWAGAAFILFFATAYHLSYVLFQHIPAIDDTVAQYVQAKFVAAGHWYIPSPPNRGFFPMEMMVNDGKWYSQYPPGHVILLALGHLAGNPAMVNPLVGAATCIAIYLLAKELYGAYTARFALILSVLCVNMLIMAAEFMNNATSLLACTLFMWSYLRVLHHNRWRDGVFGGLALGYCLITRPYPALYISLVPAFYGVWLLVSGRRQYFKSLLCMALVTSCFLGFQFYYNDITTGDPLIFGYQKLHGDKHNPATREAMTRLTAKTMNRNFRTNLERGTQFNSMLFEWPMPALALLLPLWAWRGGRRDERLVMGTVAMIFVSCQLLPGNLDFGWGPRLAYEITGCFIALFAKSIAMFPAVLRSLSRRRHKPRFYYGGGLAVLACFYLVSIQHDLKLAPLREAFLITHREGNPNLYHSMVAHTQKPALVFVPDYFYKFVAFTNPPADTSPVIFAVDSGVENQKLLDLYPNRTAYVVKGTFIRRIATPHAAVPHDTP